MNNGTYELGTFQSGHGTLKSVVSQHGWPTRIIFDKLIVKKVDKLNGLKLTWHFWRGYNQSSFKCKVLP